VPARPVSAEIDDRGRGIRHVQRPSFFQRAAISQLQAGDGQAAEKQNNARAVKSERPGIAFHDRPFTQQYDFADDRQGPAVSNGAITAPPKPMRQRNLSLMAGHAPA
jgi:hypothetical protein